MTSNFSTFASFFFFLPADDGEGDKKKKDKKKKKGEEKEKEKKKGPSKATVKAMQEALAKMKEVRGIVGNVVLLQMCM